MIKLRTVIQTKLRTIHPRVYFQVAANDAAWPYFVFNLPNNFMNEEQEIFNLDVDVWDAPANGDTTSVESLASEVWRQFNKFEHIDSDIQFSIHRDTRLTLDDDDPRIRRRKLIFQLRYFDRRLYS